MQARLVQMEGSRRVASAELETPELLIGRDPTADLSLQDAARVSRRHAVVQRHGDGHTLTDLGSSNGTSVNGIALTQMVMLTAGDTITLADEVILVYEVGEAPRGLRVPALAAAALAVIALVGGGAWWLTRDTGPELPEEALAYARRGLDAANGNDPMAARKHLVRATELLFKSGAMNDVPRRKMEEVAFARLAAALDYPGNLQKVYFKANEDMRRQQQEAIEESTVCRLDSVPASEFRLCLATRIELVMKGLYQDPAGVPGRFHKVVGERLRVENRFLRGALERGRPLTPMLRREMEAAHMPPLLHYLALIESGYRSDAVSPAKAAGLWQFMPATAKQYGLKVSRNNDERLDDLKATRAAAAYLRNLTMEFGGESLLLVLAGYNRGENGVRRALKRLENPFEDRSYWRLVEMDLLPEETATYVPRFIAAAVAGEAGLPDVETLRAAGY